MSSLSLLQGIFPTQGLNPDIPHCRQILYQLIHNGHEFEQAPGVGEGQGAWRAAVHGVTKGRTQLSD